MENRALKHKKKIEYNNKLLFKDIVVCKYGKTEGVFTFKLDIYPLKLDNTKNTYVDNKKEILIYLRELIDNLEDDIKVINTWHKRI